jgi:DNA-binding NtrC family response regulator
MLAQRAKEGTRMNTTPDTLASPAGSKGSAPAVSGGKGRILIAEDSATARKQLQQLLEESLGVVVDTVGDGSEALEALTERPYRVVVTDLRMPKVSGMELIEEVQKRRLGVPVIVTTGYGGIDEAVQAMRLGATDFLTKPIGIDHLCRVLQRALRERELEDEVAALREQLHERYSFHNILSKSPKMHAVFELIGHVARTAATVLIQGGTGTGKEMVARAIHEASANRGGPFVAINCAAVPETLLEVSCSATRRGPSPALSASVGGVLNWRTAARSFWTKSATFRPRCRPSCCASCKSAALSGWAARRASKSTCA